MNTCSGSVSKSVSGKYPAQKDFPWAYIVKEAAAKPWIKCSWVSQPPTKWLVWLSSLDPFSPITFGKSRRTTWLYYFKLAGGDSQLDRWASQVATQKICRRNSQFYTKTTRQKTLWWTGIHHWHISSSSYMSRGYSSPKTTQLVEQWRPGGSVHQTKRGQKEQTFAACDSK